MKHARKDYNRIQDPKGLIPEDEPVFLLRGQDVLAPATLEFWATSLSMLQNADPKMVEMVRNHAKTMREWQNNVKASIPDLPKS